MKMKPNVICSAGDDPHRQEHDQEAGGEHGDPGGAPATAAGGEDLLLEALRWGDVISLAVKGDERGVLFESPPITGDGWTENETWAWAVRICEAIQRAGGLAGEKAAGAASGASCSEDGHPGGEVLEHEQGAAGAAEDPRASCEDAYHFAPIAREREPEACPECGEYWVYTKATPCLALAATQHSGG